MSPLPDPIEAEAFEAYVIDVIGRRWPVDVVSVAECRRLVEEAETIAENQLDEMRDDLHATEQKLATCAAELDHSVEMWTRLELERCIAIVEEHYPTFPKLALIAAFRSGSPSNPPTDPMPAGWSPAAWQLFLTARTATSDERGRCMELIREHIDPDDTDISRLMLDIDQGFRPPTESEKATNE